MSLQPRTYSEALEKARARPQHQRTLMKRSGRMKPGRKVKEWESERARLKIQFARAGIITCEVKFPGCWFDNALSFAHDAKRRKLNKQDLSRVILACTPCHDHLEIMRAERMKEFVGAVIAARKLQP